ncbi:MAG: FeoA family protein [Candidatus Omnitrophica bacterium]|nr:FeoA family protein [Candidatus Omnitrophota bacterium]
MKKISLVQINPEEKVSILEIVGGSNLESKLLSMGVYKGRQVTKLSHIGLKGPVVIRAGRSILALGHSVAEKIIIERE